jgi:hypothetical protein
MAAYLTAAEATTLLTSVTDTAEWTAASTVDKDYALGVATEIIDNLPLIGEKKEATQTLEFPRAVEESTLETTMMNDVELACALCARIMVHQSIDEIRMPLEVSSTTFGNINVRMTNPLSSRMHLMFNIADARAFYILSKYIHSPKNLRITRV